MGKSDKSEFYRLGNVQKNFVCSDYLLFPNEHTQKCIIRDYMLENICCGEAVRLGYPRNEAFFDGESAIRIRESLRLRDKRVYAYMPTFRGAVQRGRTNKNDIYLLFFLYELDRQLTDDEVLYISIHPLARSKVDFRQFKHIKVFPRNYETYEFLNIADVLITDYSSVFFDFACTRKKIVLFPYDKEDYWSSRGMYFSMDELPFPQVESVDALINELRSEKQYEDNLFVETFCPWDGPNVSKELCDYIFGIESTGLCTQKIPNNEKENVLIYAGNLAANGITTSLRSLMSTIDLKKRNYYVTFMTEFAVRKGAGLLTFPQEVCYIPTTGDMCLTILDRIIRKLFKRKLISASQYMKLLGHRVHQEWERNFGSIKFDAVIQFNGYDQEIMLYLSTFQGPKTIFVHSDMLKEMEVRKSLRKDVYHYVYEHYDWVAVVTEGIIEPTCSLTRKKEHICLVKNAIDYKTILQKAEEDIALDEETKVFPSHELFAEVMASSTPKFINIGRFAPEKGHERLINAFYQNWKENPDMYLVIMGGSSRGGGYAKTIRQIKALGLENNVVLLCQVLNPYPILNACNYFILSSFYEGFGLVLVEADILGKAVVSVDIDGPRDFMQKNGGLIVENSEEGLCQGIKKLYEGKVLPMNVDYEAYNQGVIQEFEHLFQ